VGQIKVKTFAVLLDASRTRHLVWRGADSTRTPDRFHRLLGGHLEFGESTVAGVEREIEEELGTQLLEARLLGVLESRFVHEGEPGHEIVFVYAGQLADPDVVGPTEPGSPTTTSRSGSSGVRSRTTDRRAAVSRGRARAARAPDDLSFCRGVGHWGRSPGAGAGDAGWRSSLSRPGEPGGPGERTRPGVRGWSDSAPGRADVPAGGGPAGCGAVASVVRGSAPGSGRWVQGSWGWGCRSRETSRVPRWSRRYWYPCGLVHT
jgi:ADP-ribose pyrophosphatase YjhB (NUDIX family)